uniref:Uncharacterized protein n=1 Tax=Panagrolaimus sp. PS1159 TaxID=55785 RepID=A0AC35GI02_9BILA
MTTKDEFLFRKNKQKSFANSHIAENENNLNLNQNLKCAPIHSHSKLYHDKKSDLAVSDNYGKKSQTWNKFFKISNLPTFNDEIRKEKSGKNWEENTNSSTLSLYITAHENSSEAVTFVSFHDNENSLKNNKFGSIKKHEIFDTSTIFIQNPFEFPRQHNYEVTEPEMCQYKASQRLLNPNEASMIVQQSGTVTEIWMFLWLLIFVVSTGVIISITCNKSRQPPQRKKYSNAELTKSKKNKDEKKDGENNNKNNNVEKSRKTGSSKPKQLQSEKSSSQTTGDKSDSKAEADLQQQKSEKLSKKDKRVIQKNENLSPPQPPQQVKEQKIENTDVDVEPKSEVKISKDVITKEPDYDKPNKDDNEIAKASSNKEKRKKKMKKSAKESDEDEENDDSSKKFKKKKHKKMKKNESGDEDDENHSRKKKKSKKLKKKKAKKEDESQKPGESQKSSEELYTALSPIKSPKRPKDEDKIPGTMTRYNNLLIDGYSDEVPSKFKRFLKPSTPNIQAQPSPSPSSPIERMPLDKTQQNQCYEEEPIPIKKSKKKALARKKVVGNEVDSGKYIDEAEEASVSNKKKKLNKKKSKLGDKKEEDERIQKSRAQKRKQQSINTFDEKIAKGEIIEYNNEYPPKNDVMPVSDKLNTGSSSTDCELPKVKSEASSSRTTTIKASQNRGIDDLIDVSLATNETNHGSTQLIQNVHLDLLRKQPPPPSTNTNTHTNTTTKTNETHSTSKDRTSDNL